MKINSITKPARHESPFWHRKTRGKTRLIYFANSTGVGKPFTISYISLMLQKANQRQEIFEFQQPLHCKCPDN